MDIATQIKGLNEQRAAKFAALETLAKVITERAFNADEQKQYDGFDQEIKDFNSRIKILEDQEKRNLANAKPGAPAISTSFNSEGGEKNERQLMLEKFSWKRAFAIGIGGEQMTGVEKELDQEERKHVMEGGNSTFHPKSIMVPAEAFRQKRDMSATGGSSGSEGGVNIATTVEGIVDVFLPNMVIGKLPVTRFNNLVGNLKFPQAQTFPSANWQTENGATTEKSPTFTSLTLSPKRLTAKIQISNQLLIQSENNIRSYANRFLVAASAIEYEKVCLKGGGSNEPTGIIGGTGYTTLYAGDAVNNAVNANGSRMVWADWVKLVSSTKAVNAPNGQAYVTSPAMIGRAQITPRQSSGVEGNFIMNSYNGGTNGFPVMGTTNLPDTFSKGSSTVLSAVIFGDFSNLACASWGGMEIGVDPYVNMGEGLTNIYLNNYLDCGMLNPLAFSVIKDAQSY